MSLMQKELRGVFTEPIRAQEDLGNLKVFCEFVKERSEHWADLLSKLDREHALEKKMHAKTQSFLENAYAFMGKMREQLASQRIQIISLKAEIARLKEQK